MVEICGKVQISNVPAAGSRVYAAYAHSGDVVDRWRGRLPELQGKTLFIADEGLATEKRTVIDLYDPGAVGQVNTALFDALFPGFHTLRWIQGVDKDASATGTNMHADALLTR